MAHAWARPRRRAKYTQAATINETSRRRTARATSTGGHHPRSFGRFALDIDHPGFWRVHAPVGRVVRVLQLQYFVGN
jgi:hypothetical protein